MLIRNSGPTTAEILREYLVSYVFRRILSLEEDFETPRSEDIDKVSTGCINSGELRYLEPNCPTEFVYIFGFGFVQRRASLTEYRPSNKHSWN